nr:hypothetical protein [Tanacetum cinerariifolium]
MVFMKIDVPMKQPQPVVSTQGTYRSTPRAIRGRRGRRVLKPESHKEHPEFVDDDDDKVEKRDDNLGSLEIRTEEAQTIIPTPPSSLRKILSSDKKVDQELTNVDVIPTTTITKCSHSKRRIFGKNDDVHSHHDDHQEDDAPPKREKRVKRQKALKISMSARGSPSKHSTKDSTTYVSKQQKQQQE